MISYALGSAMMGLAVVGLFGYTVIEFGLKEAIKTWAMLLLGITWVTIATLLLKGVISF